MTTVGIRALKQNASAVVARAASGETMTITDRGRPVAPISPLQSSPIERLVGAGLARPALHPPDELPPAATAAEISPTLTRMRDDERY